MSDEVVVNEFITPVRWQNIDFDLTLISSLHLMFFRE